MIDLHCHLLPGIDDGPQTLDESLQLARIAVENGITHSVVTPHILPGRYDNDSDSIAAVFEDFREALQSEQIPLQVAMAAEVRLDPEIIGMIAENRVPFLGEVNGYKIILLEFPHGHILPGSDKLVEYLLKRNIRPLIAHPERNAGVIRQLEKIEPFVQAGCMLQLTAGSVHGFFGKPVRQRCQQMLELGWVNILASDAHDIKHRQPELEKGRQAAAQVIGEAAAWSLVREQPAAIAHSLFADDLAGLH